MPLAAGVRLPSALLLRGFPSFRVEHRIHLFRNLPVVSVFGNYRESYTDVHVQVFVGE